MKVIPPVTLTDSSLISSTVAEDDYPAWSAATAYVKGDRVIRTQTHKVYEALTASTNKVPENNLVSVDETPAPWLDLGRTNRWRMLTADANYQTSGASPLIVEFEPGERVSALAILGIEADAIEVEMYDSNDELVFTKTEALRTRDTRSWSDYFFGKFRWKPSFLALALPLVSGARIKLTLTRATGNVLCGPVVVGNPVELGKVQAGATSGIKDFSRVERDVFGRAQILRRKSVPRTTQKTTVMRGDVPRVRTALDSLRARAAVYIGVEDSNSGYFDALLVLGLINSWDLSIDYYGHSNLNLDLEGL